MTIVMARKANEGTQAFAKRVLASVNTNQEAAAHQIKAAKRALKAFGGKKP